MSEPVLLIDTSTAHISAGVADLASGNVLSWNAVDGATRHGEELAPGIANALSAAGLSISDIQSVIVGIGPGPFTGLRVGIVTAEAIAQARGIEVRGICSLDGIERPRLGHQLVVSDARRKEVYWAMYDDDRRIAGPDVARPAELADSLAGEPISTITSAGAGKYHDVLAGLCARIHSGFPAAAPMLTAATIAAYRAPLTPLYLRRPDAQPATGR